MKQLKDIIKPITLKVFNNMAYAEREALPEKIKTEMNRLDAIAFLTKTLKKNPKVNTLLRHVSSSGMSRHISCFIVIKGEMVDITFYVARVLEEKRHKRDGGITVSGCGMDMGFDLVYRLSSALYGHENRGAYTLKQGWL